MSTKRTKKIGVKQILLIVVMSVFTIAIFLFKDSIIPNINAPYQEAYATYVMTEATIVDKEIYRGRKGSNTTWIVEFKDDEGNVYRGKISQTNVLGKENGESVVIYYNPEDPAVVVSEETYKEVMR